MGESILKKIELLDAERQRQLLAFLEFLLVEQKKQHEQEFDYNDYKNRIASISVWSDEDVLEIENARNAINQWQVQEW